MGRPGLDPCGSLAAGVAGESGSADGPAPSPTDLSRHMPRPWARGGNGRQTPGLSRRTDPRDVPRTDPGQHTGMFAGWGLGAPLGARDRPAAPLPPLVGVCAHLAGPCVSPWSLSSFGIHGGIGLPGPSERNSRNVSSQSWRPESRKQVPPGPCCPQGSGGGSDLPQRLLRGGGRSPPGLLLTWAPRPPEVPLTETPLSGRGAPRMCFDLIFPRGHL